MPISQQDLLKLSNSKSPARIKAETDMCNLMNVFDNTKFSGNQYKQLFDSMTNEEFKIFMEKIANEEEYVTINIDSSRRDLTLDTIFEKCNKLGIQTHKYVIYRENKSEGDNELTSVTPHRALILYIPMKRLQQIISKKNNASGDIDKINILTGAVTSDSKSSALNDTQSLGLVSSQQFNTLKELLGPRSDDHRSKIQMLQRIEEDGEVSLKDLNITSNNKQSLTTLKEFMRAIAIDLKIK